MLAIRNMLVSRDDGPAPVLGKRCKEVTSKSSHKLCALAIVLLVFDVASVRANDWGIVTWPSPVVDSYLVDYTQGSGNVTNPRLMAPLPNGRVMGIDYDGGGTLFAATTFNDNQVYKVIEATGALIPWANLPAGGSEGGLGYNPLNGMLYAVSGPNTTSVFEIDPAVPNSVTPVMTSTGFNDVSGIAFDSLGNGYAVDTHTNTGGIAELLSVTVGSSPAIVSLGSLGIATGVTLGLDFDGSGVLHMVTSNGNFWSINPIGPTVNFIESIAINPQSDLFAGLAWRVPEPTSLTLFSAGALGLFSLRSLRRKRVARGSSYIERPLATQM